MIINDNKQVKLEFGTGDISIAGGYTTGDEVKGFVVFENQEAREIGSPGITKQGEVELDDYDVVMTFGNKGSIDALIGQLELVKSYMSQENQPDIEFEEVDHLGNDSRGGYGSTGKQ